MQLLLFFHTNLQHLRYNIKMCEPETQTKMEPRPMKEHAQEQIVSNSSQKRREMLNNTFWV